MVTTGGSFITGIVLPAWYPLVPEGSWQLTSQDGSSWAKRKVPASWRWVVQRKYAKLSLGFAGKLGKIYREFGGKTRNLYGGFLNWGYPDLSSISRSDFPLYTIHFWIPPYFQVFIPDGDSTTCATLQEGPPISARLHPCNLGVKQIQDDFGQVKACEISRYS